MFPFSLHWHERRVESTDPKFYSLSLLQFTVKNNGFSLLLLVPGRKSLNPWNSSITHAENGTKDIGFCYRHKGLPSATHFLLNVLNITPNIRWPSASLHESLKAILLLKYNIRIVFSLGKCQIIDSGWDLVTRKTNTWLKSAPWEWLSPLERICSKSKQMVNDSARNNCSINTHGCLLVQGGDGIILLV